MTGFGKASENSPYGEITVELKTLNHKSLSITCNPFSGFFLMEERVKRIIEGKIFRGKTFVRVACGNTEGKKPLQKVSVNETIAKEYLKKIKYMQKKLGVKGEVQIKELISFPGVLESSTEENGEKLWKYVKGCLEEALEKLVVFRTNEGKRIAKDFNKRLKVIEVNIKAITKFGKKCIEDYRKKLVKSIKNIAEQGETDKRKLEEEVASFARNCDVAEEITRLNGHLTAFRDSMKNVKADAGKKLDFIAQEMQRESNTIGAKSSDLRIAKAVIDLKSEIEKIREQIRNIE